MESFNLVGEQLHVPFDKSFDCVGISADQLTEVIEGFIRANRLSCRQVAVVLINGFHVSGFSPGGEKTSEEFLRRQRLVCESLANDACHDFRNFIKCPRLIAQPMRLSAVCARISQARGRDCSNIVTINPAHPTRPDVMANDPIAHDRNSAVTEKIFHVDFRAEMGVRNAGPFDVAFDELVPAMVRDLDVIRAAGSEMDYISHQTSWRGLPVFCSGAAYRPYSRSPQRRYRSLPEQALWFRFDHSQRAP